jgi:hypothetical protein
MKHHVQLADVPQANFIAALSHATNVPQISLDACRRISGWGKFAT